MTPLEQFINYLSVARLNIKDQIAELEIIVLQDVDQFQRLYQNLLVVEKLTSAIFTAEGRRA